MSKTIKYKKSIIKALYFSKSLSCGELSEILDLSVPVITRLISELITSDIIVEAGFAPSKGGRRPLAYALKKDIFFIVSVAMDQFVTTVSVMTANNKGIGVSEIVNLPLLHNVSAVERLVAVIKQVITDSGVPKKNIIGVGIGMPGFVNGAKGINYSFLETSDDISLVAYLSLHLDLPVFIENDSSVIALGELKFGAAKNNDNTMVINIGWGVGLGLIINGTLFRGSNGFAGEFSHIPLFSNNKLCNCGKKGCMETETSLFVMIHSAIEGLKAGRISSLCLGSLCPSNPEASSSQIIEAARKGDQFAVELISNIGYNIGRGVSVLIHLLNPNIIILGGRGSMAGKLWQAPIQQAINEHCIPRLGANTTVTVSELGYQAEIIGAAALVMENYDNEKFNDRNIDLLHRKSNADLLKIA